MRILALTVAVCWLAALCTGAYIERWEGTVTSNHCWRSWAEVPGWTGSVHMIHHPFGGLNNSDYVRSPGLDSLEPWIGCYWPAYTEDTDPTNKLREVSQEVHLDVDSVVYVHCRTLSSTDTLYGGSVYFFVGEWSTNGSTAFYRHSAQVTVNTNNWAVRSVIDLSQGTWLTITNISGRPVDQVYTNPQQYGFVIVGATNQPGGELGFDGFFSVAKDLALTNLTAVVTNLYAATNLVSAGTDFNVENGSKVDVRAGREILLQPGFHADAGGSFRAAIDRDL